MCIQIHTVHWYDHMYVSGVGIGQCYQNGCLYTCMEIVVSTYAYTVGMITDPNFLVDTGSFTDESVHHISVALETGFVEWSTAILHDRCGKNTSSYMLY